MVVAYGAVEAAPVPRPAANRYERERCLGYPCTSYPLRHNRPVCSKAQTGEGKCPQLCPARAPPTWCEEPAAVARRRAPQELRQACAFTPGSLCRRYAMGLAAAAGLALIGVVAIAMSGEKHEPVALAVSATQGSTRL